MYYANIPYPWGIKLGKEYPTYLGTFEDTLEVEYHLLGKKLKN
jgi:hypothetical protein